MIILENLLSQKNYCLRINNIIKKNNKIDLKSKHIVGAAEIDLNKMTINLKIN